MLKLTSQGRNTCSKTGLLYFAIIMSDCQEVKENKEMRSPETYSQTVMKGQATKRKTGKQ